MTAQLQVIAFGEGSGHPFHGNQHTGGLGSAERTPSLRQSEERIREALPNAKVDLEWHFEKFGMRVSDVPPVPMDRKLADITAGRIEKFAAEFPESAATIAGVNMAEGASGYAQTNFATLDGDPVISLNPDFYPSEKTLQDGLTDPSWVGVAVATPEGVIDHELGHVLDFSRDADYVDRLRGPGYYSGRTETFNERSNMGKISEYAAQGGGPEAFAEAFALHQSGADIPVANAERAIDSAVNEAHQSHSNDHAPAVAASGMVGGHTCEGFGPPPKTKRADLGEGAGHPFRGNQYSGGSGRGEGSGREQKMKAAEDRISKVIGGNLGPTAGAVPPDKRVDLTLMDQKLATEVADRVEVFAKEFPAAADRIGAVVTAPLEEGVRAETRVSPEGDLGILLNRDDYQDATTLRDVLGSPLNSTATFDTQGVIDHELGHVLDVMAPQNGSLGADTFWSDSQMENVSDYASTDPQEAVAEAFAVRQEGADAETVLPTAVERQITAAVDEVKTHPGEDRKEQASVFGSAFADWKPVCSGYPGKRITSYAAVQPLAFGEAAGHAFRGNQWTGGSGLAEAISRMDPSIFYEERMQQLNPAQQAELRQLTKDLSTWDLASWQERIAARDSGADWYQRLDRFAAESPPVSETLYRGTGQEVTEGEHISMPLSNWSTDRETSSEYIRSDGTKTGSLLVLPPSQDVHAFDASLIDKDPPPMFNYMAGGDFVVTSKSDTGQAILAPAPRTASAEFGDAPGHPFRGNQYRGGEGGATVTNGVAWMMSQKTPEEKAAFHERLGNCYPLSGQYVTSHPDATLVHGTIQGMGFPPNPHAWVENADGTVHEPASDRNWTPEAFKDYFHPVVDDRYSSHDAARMMVGTGNYGPWTDEERKTAEFGEGAGHPFRGNQYTSGLSDSVDSSWRDVHPFSKEQQNWLREREQFYRDNDMLSPSNVAAGFHQHEDSDEAMRMRSAFYDQLGIPRTMDEHVDQFTRYDNKDVIAADREPTRAENDLAEEWLIHRDDAQYEHPNVGDQQVSVYRGGYSEQARNEPTGTVTELPINVLSSWTTDPATARDFGPVYKAQVDMKDVFHADPPNAGESEVIVFTDDLTRQAIRVDSTERGTRSGGPSMAASAEFGDSPGHPFRGNQWKDIGSHAEVKAAKRSVLESMHYALGPGDRMTHEINSLPSRMNAMWRTPQEAVLQSRGHSPESIKEADSLIHQHSGNSQSQDQADAAISRAFNDPNSEVGAVLRDRAELESQVHDAYRQGIDEWANAQRDVINAADWGGQGPTMDHSIPVETWTEHALWTSPGPEFNDYYAGQKDMALRRVDSEATDADMYYRQAGSEGRKDVEAWTINPEGADTMAATNPGENLITPDTHATYDQLNDQGYRLLVQQTGIAGAPGEGEALWVKDKRSVVAAVQPLEMGEHAGHPFRGNQWTDIGHGGVETRAIHYVEQLYNGEKVSIPADQVATVLDVIGRQAADAKAAGREARDINLCNASVEGANMFCSDSFGIPRQDMAQLAGDVVPGSQAALDNPGEKNIDATDKFLDSLRDQGVPFTRDVVPAQELKATQNELSGAKVAGMMNADMLDQERLFREPLVVSKENYILDGHHRWAAGIGLEYMDGKLDSDVTANVYRVDAPITELMTDAKTFASSYGIKSEGIKSFTKGGNFSVVQVQILEFGEGHGHAFRGNQHTGGIGGEHEQLPTCPPSCRERELAVLHQDNLAIEGKLGDEMRPTNLQYEHTPERMGQWAPEREALHNEIVANALRAAEERGVPQDSQMVLMGGLPGAGKSSATEDILDPKDWLMISPDDVKLQLAERGDIPTPDGMKAMEASPLVGDEAMKVSWDLADQATAQGYNVVWDMTGDDASWYSERIQNARSTLPESEPYKTTGIFVDVPIDQSKDQVSSRYAKGAESTYGGRPVPQDYIERSRDPQYGSTQRRAFEESRSLLDQVMVIDNTDHKQQVVEKTPGFTLD